MLLELLSELTRQQPIATTVQAARREPGPEQWSAVREALLKKSRPTLGSIVTSQVSKMSPLVVDRSALIL